MVPHDNVAEGEIIISSPAKSAFCYYNNPEMTEQKFYKGFLYTGDVGTWTRTSSSPCAAARTI